MRYIYSMKENEQDELNLITLAQQYSDEDKARELLESMLWPDGPVCPHCKNHKEKKITKLQPKEGSKTQRALCLRSMSQTVHRENRNSFRGFSHSD